MPLLIERLFLFGVLGLWAGRKPIDLIQRVMSNSSMLGQQ